MLQAPATGRCRGLVVPAEIGAEDFEALGELDAVALVAETRATPAISRRLRRSKEPGQDCVF